MPCRLSMETGKKSTSKQETARISVWPESTEVMNHPANGNGTFVCGHLFVPT